MLAPRHPPRGVGAEPVRFLERRDYQRLFEVLDHVSEATDLPTFCGRVLASLGRCLGWHEARILEQSVGATVRALRHRWDREGLLMPIGPDPLDRLTIVVPRAALRSFGPRDHEIARRLTQLLTPLAHQHLNSRRAMADEWGFTEREREVADLVSQGMTTRHIGEHLQISTNTVKKHISRALDKTGCTNRTELALRWQTRR